LVENGAARPGISAWTSAHLTSEAKKRFPLMIGRGETFNRCDLRSESRFTLTVRCHARLCESAQLGGARFSVTPRCYFEANIGRMALWDVHHRSRQTCDPEHVVNARGLWAREVRRMVVLSCHPGDGVRPVPHQPRNRVAWRPAWIQGAAALY